MKNPSNLGCAFTALSLESIVIGSRARCQRVCASRFMKTILIFYGTLLVTVTASQVPFLETFEAVDGIAIGMIHGQNGWILNEGTADVQSSVSQAGSQALQVQNAQVFHDLSSSNSALWLHFQARCTAAPEVNPSVTDANTSLAFFVNTNLNLVVYSNTVPIELAVQIQTNTWMRFDIYCDYDDLYWDLSMDGINVAAGLPLYSTNSHVGSIVIGNESASPVYIDQIDIADTEQTTGGLPDSDSDEIPDWWEQKHFGGVTSVTAGNISDNDGLTYLETYISGVSPTSFDPFMVSLVSGGNRLSWNPIQSRLYSVYWTSILTNEFSLLQENIPYPQSEFIDLVHSEETSGFYRLKVQVE